MSLGPQFGSNVVQQRGRLPNTSLNSPVAVVANSNTQVLATSVFRNRLSFSNLDVNPMWISVTVMTGPNQGIQVPPGASLLLSADDWPTFVPLHLYAWSVLGGNCFVETGQVLL